AAVRKFCCAVRSNVLVPAPILRLPSRRLRVFRELRNWHCGCMKPSDENDWRVAPDARFAVCTIRGAQRMDDQRWKELCRLIMSEQDPQKLLRLVSDLNQEFERREKERGSQQNPEAEASDTADPGAGIPEDCT